MIVNGLKIEDKAVAAKYRFVCPEQADGSAFKMKLAAAWAKQTQDKTQAEMSLAEYKAKIYRQLSEMSIHPALSKTEISIHISDKAFERMKKDADYETKMLGLIDRDLNEGWCAGLAPAYSVIYVGETESDYSASSMGSAYKDTYDKKSENSFWERRRKRRKEMKEYEEERAEKLATMKIRAKKAAEMAYRRKRDPDAQVISSVSAAELLAGLHPCQPQRARR